MWRTRADPFVRLSGDSDSVPSHVAFSQALSIPLRRLLTPTRRCMVFRIQVDHLRCIATQIPRLLSQTCRDFMGGEMWLVWVESILFWPFTQLFIAQFGSDAAELRCLQPKPSCRAGELNGGTLAIAH